MLVAVRFDRAMSSKLKQFLQRWLINTAAVLVAAYLVKGIHYDTATSLLVATLVLGILNAILRPLLMLLSLPLVILTLGLFVLVINALLLYGVGSIIKGFHVDTFGSAFWGAVVIFLVSLVLNSLTGTGDSRVQVRRGGAPPPSRGDDGGGPVIDV
jgi:putative membrane protein